MTITRLDFLRGSLAAAALVATRVPAAFADEPPLRIGVLTDLSGNFSDAAGRGAVIAAQMAIDEFGGAIGTRKIELLEADHQNKADIGSAVARQWFDEKNVGAIFEMVSSSVALAVQDLARERGRITVVTGAATSALTAKACSPTGMHWVHDTYSLANSTALEMVKRGGDTWFFITADYGFGHALEADATALIQANGGKVIGATRYPLGSVDFSSYLLQAQSSGAKVIAFANAGKDFSTSISQAREFGVGASSGQELAGLLVTLSEAKAIGLEAAQGLLLTESFYWDTNEETRAWSKSFADKNGSYPTSIQAGTYSAVRHYLRAIKELNSDVGAKVASKMRELRVDDAFAHGGIVREDGRMVHDLYFLQMKKPEESTGEWDLYNLVNVVPGDKAFRPLTAGGCPLVAAK